MPDSRARELTGKTAVVTGASSGIGRAIALELAAAGADVVVHARANRDLAGEVVDQIGTLGRQAEMMLADLADPAAQYTLVEGACDWRGDVDIWVNNAGADVLTGEAAGWTFERKLERLWRVDVAATIRLSRLIGKRMKRRGDSPARGAILNMGWDQADHGMGSDSGEMFAAVKGAIMAFSKSLAQSLAPDVRVNCLAPGWIKTAWAQQASEDWQRRAQDECLLARWGTPQDVAHVARFLVSPAAAFVTGQVVSINGGFQQSQ